MTKLNLTYSADMIQNYLQGEVISPQQKFEALQTNDGHSLLLSIGDDHIFYLTEEQSGKTRTGWSRTDLSSALIKKDFNGRFGVKVRTFEAGQSAADQTLGMAMAISADGVDNLYVSLGNSNKDISWAAKPSWTSYPFDAGGTRSASLKIVGAFFAETTESNQYIIVDILRDPSSGVKDIERYYIDPTKADGTHWVKHDLPIDIEAESYQSCVGQIPKGMVDGIYTAGTAAGTAQLAYVPVSNIYGDGPALPTRLELPDAVVASAIASARASLITTNMTTNLFAMSGNTLYFFAADKQKDEAVAAALVTHDVFSETGKLIAMQHEGVTTLWGLNSSDEVYYLSCHTVDLDKPASWSTPVPILTGMEEISAYLNAADGGNTIFASGGGKLQKITQATNTSGKLWRPHEIKLSAPPTQKSLSFNSYTTTLQLTDENDLPAKNVNISITANSRSPVYMNGLYYVLDATPVHVMSDALGSVTVIDATNGLSGATFAVTAGGGSVVKINPMDKPFKKIAALNTPEKLQGATISKQSGGTAPLVPASTSSHDLRTVAGSMGNLSTAYTKIMAPSVPTALRAAQPVSAMVLPSSLGNIGDDIAMAAGDLFNWLESGVESVINVIKDAAGDAWHFIANIAGKVYRAVLDTTEAVLGAVQWVFNAIKTAVTDLIRFIEFLFEWDDIKRTKEVLHNVVKRCLEGQVGEIETLKKAFNDQVAAVEKTINQWSDITDWSGLGEPAESPAVSSSSNPTKGQTSGSQLMAHHFQNHANNITVKGKVPTRNLAKSLIDDLLAAVKNEAHVLEAVYAQLKRLADDFSSLTVSQIIQRIGGILADGVLSSCQVVVDALLDVLFDVASAAIEIFDTKIHIPIISDILNAIGISDISFLDLFCWISAAAYTVVYKIAEGKAPFPEGQDTSLVINAQTWGDLQKLFRPPPASVAASIVTAPDESVAASTVTAPDEFKSPIFVAGHSISGLMALMSDFVSTFEAESETGDNPFSTPSAVMGVVGAVSAGAADALVPKDPIENDAVRVISTSTTAIVILSKVIFSGPVQEKLGASEGTFKGLAAADGRATGAVINTLLIIPALFTTGWHFYELAKKPEGPDRSAAIVGEVSNLASYVSRTAYAIAVNDPDPVSKLAPIAVMAVANVAVAGLQTAEAIIN